LKRIERSPSRSTTTALSLVLLPLYPCPPERATSGRSNRSAQRTTARTSAVSRTCTTAGGFTPSQRVLNTTRAGL
jgi:hypothetical protein